MKRYGAMSWVVMGFALILLSACGFNEVASTEPTLARPTESTASIKENLSVAITPSATPTPISSPSSTPLRASANPPTVAPTVLYTPTFTSTPIPTASSPELTRAAELALTPSATPIPSPTPVTPSQPGFLTTIAQVGGYTGAVAIQGQFVFLGVGPRLIVLDISNPSQPQAVGQTGILPGIIQALSIQDSYAYILTQDNSLHIFNISDISNLQEIGSYQPENGRDHRSEYWGLKIIEQRAYLLFGGYTSFLSIVDMTNPIHPVEIAVHELPRDVADIAVSGSYLYAASNREGLFIIDVTDPAAPIDVARQPGEFSSIAIQGTAVFLAAGEAGMRIFDISNPTKPAAIGVYQTESMPVSKVIVEGNLAYVSDSYATQGTRYVFFQYGPPSLSGTVRVVDITNPTQPAEISSFTTPVENWSMAEEDNKVFLATGSLRIFDLTVAEQPTEIGLYEIPGEVWDVVVNGKLAYVAGGVEGLYVIDVASPATPALVSTSQTFSGHAFRIVQEADRLYLTNNYRVAFFNDSDDPFMSIRIFDTSNPADPVEAGTYRLSEEPFVLGDFTAVSTTLYTIQNGSLHLTDMRDPINPVALNAISLTDFVNSIAIDGHYVFLTSRSDLLHVLDISDPTNPLEISTGFDGREAMLANYSPQLSISMNQIVVTNGFAFVECVDAEGESIASNLCVLDVREPASPKFVSLYQINSTFRDLTAANGYIFITTRNALLVLDPANPAALDLVDSIPLTNPQGIEIVGSTLYVANGAGGLVILQIPAN